MEEQFKINHVSSRLYTAARAIRLVQRKKKERTQRKKVILHGVQQKLMPEENLKTINGDIVKKDVLVVKTKLYLLGLAH